MNKVVTEQNRHSNSTFDLEVKRVLVMELCVDSDTKLHISVHALSFET